MSNTIILSDVERAAIQRIRASIDTSKMTLADRTLERLNAERRQLEAEGAVNEQVKKLETRFHEIATDHGLDLNDPKAGRWTFSFATMEFKRLDIPATPEPAT